MFFCPLRKLFFQRFAFENGNTMQVTIFVFNFAKNQSFKPESRSIFIEWLDSSDFFRAKFQAI